MEDARDAVTWRAATPAQPSAMPVTNHPAPDIRRSAPRPRWHRLYYLLAAFDLVTVALSLVLNHHTRSLFARSIEVNQVWGQRLTDYSELAQLAAAVNAPGNDVFDSLDVPGESGRLRAARAAFDERFAALRQEVQSNASPVEGARVVKDFDALAVAMDQMIAEAELIFSYLAQGQSEQAGRRMATMDRRYAVVNTELSDLRRNVAAIQQENFAQQETVAEDLAKFEYLIAAAILLMINAATLYGRKLANRVEADSRERERYVEELRDAEARTRSIVDTAADGIVTFDERGIIETANASVGHLFGSPAPALVGQPIAEHVPQLSVSSAHVDSPPSPSRGDRLPLAFPGDLGQHGHGGPEPAHDDLPPSPPSDNLLALPPRGEPAAAPASTISERGALPPLPSQERVNPFPCPSRGEGWRKGLPPPLRRSYQEVEGRRADGTTVPLELAVTELSLGDRRMFTAVIRDVTERKQAEEQRRRLVHEQAARAEAEAAAERIHRLQALTDAALAHLGLDDLLRVLLGRVRDLLASETAAVLLLEGEELVVRAAAGLDDEVERANRVPLGVGFAGRIAAERRTIMVEDVGQADSCPSLREKGIKSLLGAPLLVEGRVLGVLHVGTLVGRRWSEEDAQLLRLAADRVALAIDNARLYQRERERAERLGLLAETGKDLVAARSLDVLLRLGLQRALTVGGYELGRVLLLREDDGRLEAEATLWADGTPLHAAENPLSGDVGRRAIQERRPVALGESGDEINLVPHEDTATPLTALFLPLITSEGRAVGVFALERLGDGRPLPGTDLDELRVLAAQLAGVLESARLQERLRHHLDALLALHGAGRVLTSTLDPETVGARLLDVARQVCPAEAGVLRLRGERGQLRVRRTLGPEPLRRRAARAQGARAARAGAVVDGTPHAFQLKPAARNAPGVAGWCVPLRVRQRVLGILEVYGTGLNEEATGEVLGNLATVGATALENARLYGALTEREQQLQDLVGRLILAQEEERRRVAYNLHDGLAQTAAGAHLHLQAFARRYQPHLPTAREDLERALELARRTVREARMVVAELRPTALDDLGLEAALRLEAEELQKVDWQVEYAVELGPNRLAPAVETALFRVAQESLTNARKHAQTTRVRITVRRTRRGVRLEVRDWGRGFRPEAQQQAGGGPGERVGLSGMRERVALLGGRCEVHSRPGEGTRVVAEVPLPVPTMPKNDVAAPSPLMDM